MFNWLLNLGKTQAEYGVAMYGVQNPEPINIFLMILKFAIFPIVIPIILTVGVLVYMKKKAYPIAKRVWTVVIMLTVYFALFIGAGFLFNWF